MSLPASSIPAFTAALKQGLAARPALTNVVVTDGPAPPGQIETSELVELLDVNGDQVVHSINRSTQPRLEQMTLTVLITVIWKTTEKQTDVNARAFALLDELDQLLRDSDTGVTAIYIANSGPGRVYGPRRTSMKHTKRSDPNNTVREAGLEVGVYWEARI